MTEPKAVSFQFQIFICSYRIDRRLNFINKLCADFHIFLSLQTEEFEQRPYQQAIVDVCIQRNSIVYLPTGAGKSYIAIQVIKHFDNQLEL